MALLVSALGSQAAALGLGELSYSSYLGQPLDARITLISPEKDYDTNELKVRQLSAEQAATMGVELLSYFQRFEIEPVLNNGQLYIKLHSEDPVTEPFINFFIELKWPQGKVYREYTLLLDPPAVAPAQLEQASPQAQQRPQAATRAKVNPRPAAATRPAMSLSQDQYRVRSGDSLSRIAQRLSQGSQYHYSDIMNWLLANNPQAFIKGDPNRLKAAVVLNLPNEANWSTVAKPAPKTLAEPAKPAQSPVRKLTPLPATKQQAVSVAQQQPQAAEQNLSSEPRLSLQTTATTGQAETVNDVALLNEEQLRERIRRSKEQNDQLQRENKAIEARLKRLEGSDYIKSLERLVQLREQELAELRALNQNQELLKSTAMATANQAASGNKAALNIDSKLNQNKPADTANSEPAAGPSRLWLWLLLLAGVAGSVYFFITSRRKQPELNTETPEFDEGVELARLDEALASQDQSIGYESEQGDINFSSLFDESGQPTGGEHIGKWRPDPELSKKIQAKTQSYVPESPKGFHVVHHHEHDNVDDLISDALAYCAQGYYDKAESMLMAEEATRGAESRISTALDYVRNLKQQSE
ncbi:hypothetical protein NO559_12355 [Dasania sp. GY-MA-18]|uniref:FimV N-terminal domain-containing protein n=1 Tax=Dasania phycosphaerae TaxID=2950436 RepID=A0A9J6RNT6_9GAMM|nr:MULTISPECIES: hypothetical protein [Dasania]MCR8923568.1 hypothetical protein [Dasania sp. GY-MA-18]MCZ0866002.1 hypothetical protein [Dasania phycosphaerae]MCZ0869726.1 hypothetical protein [Dasania phycosphaerae]